MKQLQQLPIVWQRLVAAGGRTCPRCDATYQHLQNTVLKLRDTLKPLGLEPVLEIREISEGSFKERPAASNRIWIAGKPMEEWLGAGVGSSQCCSVCGDSSCRTVELDGSIYEDIPETVILRAALIAASAQMA